MPSTEIVLGPNQYGKAEVRLVRITRDSDRHEIEDLNVSSHLRGDFAGAYLSGDNAQVVATDTQKNTVYAFAKDGIGPPERFLLRLAEHFTSEFPWVDGGLWEAERFSWERILVDGQEHDHSFVRAGTERRTAAVTVDGEGVTVISGLCDLTVLKSTGSEFTGFPRDRYTTLEETKDRILATDVTARWRYNTVDVDFDAVFADVRRLLLEAFARTHSYALQQSLYQMGTAVLEVHPQIEEIRFSMPNKHHFLVDLAPFGLENPNEVFYAADRPYGLIEAAVQREGAVPSRAWDGLTGFC